MNAGKTTQLLQVAHNYIERGMNPYLLKPSLDDREGTDAISSRIGVSKDCELFTEDEDLYIRVQSHNQEKTLHCILIDEAQFLSPDQVWQLARVVDELNIPVMAYGLRVDFRAQFFPGSAELMAIADELREIRTIDESGKKATMVLRLDEHGKPIKEGPQNLIGGNETYRAVTRTRWREAMNK